MVLFDKVIDLVVKFVTYGGGFWLLWGIVILAGGLKDKNGPALQSGIWQIIGGGLIISAAVLFNSITTMELPSAVVTGFITQLQIRLPMILHIPLF